MIYLPEGVEEVSIITSTMESAMAYRDYLRGVFGDNPDPDYIGRCADVILSSLSVEDSNEVWGVNYLFNSLTKQYLRDLEKGLA